MKERFTVSINEEMMDKINNMAYLTGRRGRNRIGNILRDSVNVYNWILGHQIEGNTIVSLTPRDLIEMSERFKAGEERKTLVHFILPIEEREKL